MITALAVTQAVHRQAFELAGSTGEHHAAIGLNTSGTHHRFPKEQTQHHRTLRIAAHYWQVGFIHRQA
jgi:hypothetical protein